MTNVYKINNLESLLQCAICLDRFRSPKVLACQHTFCLACLQSMYNVQNRTLMCPTCRRVSNFTNGPDELPGNLLLTNLMDVQPAKAKCPCCHKVETLTICEHCNCTKCTNCNEKHLDDIRLSTKTTLEELQNTNQDDLKDSIRDACKKVRNEICAQFQNIRQQHDAILLNKQMDILKQLELNEQTLLLHVENDLQTLEQTRLELTRKNYHLDSKNEPELISLMATVNDVQSRLAEKLAQHHAYMNSIEISLQYDQDHLDQLNQLCNSIRLSVTKIDEDNANKVPKLTKLTSDRTTVTLRTFLGQEFKCRISLDETIRKLKETLGKQENIDPNRIILSKSGNYFDELDNERTLNSYNCDSTTTTLMIAIRK